MLCIDPTFRKPVRSGALCIALLHFQWPHKERISVNLDCVDRDPQECGPREDDASGAWIDCRVLRDFRIRFDLWRAAVSSAGEADWE